MDSSNYPRNVRTILKGKWVVAVTVLMSLLFLVFNLSTSAAEQMHRFDVAIQIGANGWVKIEERIQYEFPEDVPSHGIIRMIPVEYQTDKGKRRVRFEFMNVTDEQGAKLVSEVKKQGEYQAIRVGDPNVVFQGGKQTYVITYRVKGVINEFEDHDEFYWNVTGEEWQIPILSSNVEIQLPASPDTSQLRVQCLTGIFRSKEKKCSILPLSRGIVVGQITEILKPNEGFTVVVGFPKGLVKGVGWWEKNYQTILAVFILLIPVGVLMWIIRHWHRHGRDPQGRTTIIAEYEPPEGMLPAQAGVVMDEKADIRDISATILDFAVRGFMKIRKVQTKTLGVFPSSDYELVKVKDPQPGSLSEYERLIFVNLFTVLDNKIKLSSLKNSFYVHLPSVRKALYTSVVDKGWFSESPERIRNKYLTIGSVLMVLFFLGTQSVGALFALTGFLSFAIEVALFLSGFIFLVCSRWMPKKTEKGAVARDWLLGFKDFVTTTEHDRMLFHYAPEKSPERFEKYLPYAVALKIEKQWTQLFDDVYQKPPSWYEGDIRRGFSMLVMLNVLNDFTKDVSQAIVTSPRGAASGGWRGVSGFGGGFSGGGFGGGGGGRW